MKSLCMDLVSASSLRFIIGGARAGNMVVISSNQIQVTVPSGTFGYATVEVRNPYFEGERSTPSSQYFYSGQPVGDVSLAENGSGPVSALVYQDQIIYAVTGGNYQSRNSEGVITGSQSYTSGKLILVDVSDPVKPEILDKEIAGDSEPYFYSLIDSGFIDVEVNETTLVAVSDRHLVIFDITLKNRSSGPAEYRTGWRYS